MLDSIFDHYRPCPTELSEFSYISPSPFYFRRIAPFKARERVPSDFSYRSKFWEFFFRDLVDRITLSSKAIHIDSRESDFFLLLEVHPLEAYRFSMNGGGYNRAWRPSDWFMITDQRLKSILLDDLLLSASHVKNCWLTGRRCEKIFRIEALASRGRLKSKLLQRKYAGDIWESLQLWSSTGDSENQPLNGTRSTNVPSMCDLTSSDVEEVHSNQPFHCCGCGRILDQPDDRNDEWLCVGLNKDAVGCRRKFKGRVKRLLNRVIGQTSDWSKYDLTKPAFYPLVDTLSKSSVESLQFGQLSDAHLQPFLKILRALGKGGALKVGGRVCVCWWFCVSSV